LSICSESSSATSLFCCHLPRARGDETRRSTKITGRIEASMDRKSRKYCHGLKEQAVFCLNFQLDIDPCTECKNNITCYVYPRVRPELGSQPVQAKNHWERESTHLWPKDSLVCQHTHTCLQIYGMHHTAVHIICLGGKMMTEAIECINSIQSVLFAF